jgi:hypothetical protein
MTEEQRWQKEFRLKQEHNLLLSQIRNELCRIANAMATVEDEGMESTDEPEEPKNE